jgi:membrane associated rhomboid family serine protease
VSFPPPQLPPPLPRATQSAPQVPNPPRRSGRQRRPNFGRSDNKTTVTNAIVSINVGLYLWMTLAGFNRTSINFVISRQFLEQGEWWRLISCGFVHFGIFHIAMNMLLAFQLGQLLEQRMGSLRFGLLYITSLLGGSVGALLLSPDAITGGASGAVFGLMAAAVIGLRHDRINPLRTAIGTTLVLNIVITLVIPGISVGGHFGGAITGAICSLFLLNPSRKTISRLFEVVGPMAIGVGLIYLAVSFVNA